MTQAAVVMLALVCVALTAAAQLALRSGMSSPAVQRALEEGWLAAYLAAASSPLVWVGLLCFGASVGLWLIVLARLEVSVAYPLAALGIALTAVAGVVLLGESFTLWKVVGVSLVVAGVLVLALRA